MGKYVPLDWTSGTAPFLNGANLDHIEQGIYQSQTETRSAIQTTQQGVASVPTGTFNGQCEGSIGGQSLVNSVTNPDFAGGVAGWTAVGCTQSVTSNVNTLTGDGSSAYMYIKQTLNTIYQANKYLHIGAKILAVLAGATALKVSIYDAADTTLLGETTVTSYTTNTYADVINKVALTGGTAGGKVVLRIGVLWPAAATANTKVCKINGLAGIKSVDLGTSASDPNYNKTNAELNNMIGGGLDYGINSVENAKLVSTGKNLFDKTKVGNIGYRINENAGSLFPDTPLTGRYCVSDYISVKSTTTYKRSFETTLDYAYSWATYDDNFNFISSGFGSMITIPSNAEYIRITTNTLLLNIAQLEEGSTATTYQPYISSTLTPNKVLRSVPNGIKDRIYWVNGECYFEQNVKSWILASGDITAYTTTNTNNDVITITKPTDSNIYNVATQSLANSQTFGFPNFMAISAITDATTSIGMLCNASTTTIQIAVANTTYADLAAARTALAGTVINYQLATPITTKLDLSFRCYENGSFACSGSALNPVIAVTTPTTIAGSVNDNIRGLTQAMRILSEQFQFLNEKNQTFDANNIVTDYRLTNQAGVLIYKAVLSGGTSPSYTTLTETYYDNSGNLQYTVTSTLTWVSAYKLDSKVVSSIV